MTERELLLLKLRLTSNECGIDRSVVSSHCSTCKLRLVTPRSCRRGARVGTGLAMGWAREWWREGGARRVHGGSSPCRDHMWSLKPWHWEQGPHFRTHNTTLLYTLHTLGFPRPESKSSWHTKLNHTTLHYSTHLHTTLHTTHFTLLYTLHTLGFPRPESESYSFY